MAQRCDILGTGVQTGNMVSHSNRKTRRRFLPNLQKVTLKSDVLGREYRFSIASSTLRSIDHNGGLDAFLLTTSDRKLTKEAAKLKRVVRKAAEQVKAA